MLPKIKVKNAILQDKIYIYKKDIDDSAVFESRFRTILDKDIFEWFQYDSETELYTIPSNAYHKLEIDKYTDNRQFIEAKIPFHFSGKLRPEQQKVSDAFFSRKNRITSGLFQAPCGWGKTYVGCHLIAKAHLPTLILVHTKLLFKQWQEELKKQIPNTPIGTVGDGEFNIQELTVGIYKSVYNNLPYLNNTFSMVIVDEAHLCPAEMFSTALNNINCKIKIAITATPKRKDGKHLVLSDYFTPFKIYAEDPNKKENPSVKFVITDIPFTVFDPKKDWGKQLTKLGELTEYINLISEIANRDIANGRCPLILSDRVGMLKKLHTLINKSALLIGETKEEQRKDILQNAGTKYKAILSTKIFDEGISCHRLDTLYLTCPSNNPIKLEQRIGRILRQHPEKKHPVIRDFQFNGAIVHNQQMNRLKWYREKEFTI
jgi:superfamily II DNA or RNA helicase